MDTNTDLYEQDFFQWTQTTAALIRQGKWHAVDAKCVAEELESLGKRDRRELASRLQVLVMHLLKWHYQPEGWVEGHSWRGTIRTQRLNCGYSYGIAPVYGLRWLPLWRTSTQLRGRMPVTRRDCPRRLSPRNVPGLLSRCWTMTSGQRVPHRPENG
jgi:hypothetical protein